MGSKPGIHHRYILRHLGIDRGSMNHIMILHLMKVIFFHFNQKTSLNYLIYLYH